MIKKNKTSSDLEAFFNDEKILYGRTRMRFIEDHNTKRMITALSNQGITEDAVKPMAAMIFTVPGIPVIEAGQKIGETKGRI